MSKTKALPTTHLQAAASRAIQRSGRSRYRVAMQCGWKASRIYQALDHRVNGATLEQLLAAVGAVVQIGDERLRLSLTPSGEVAADIERKRTR